MLQVYDQIHWCAAHLRFAFLVAPRHSLRHVLTLVHVYIHVGHMVATSQVSRLSASPEPPLSLAPTCPNACKHQPRVARHAHPECGRVCTEGLCSHRGDVIPNEASTISRLQKSHTVT